MAGIDAPVTVGHRPAVEKEERPTANSPVRPMMPGRVLVTAVAVRCASVPVGDGAGAATGHRGLSGPTLRWPGNSDEWRHRMRWPQRSRQWCSSAAGEAGAAARVSTESGGELRRARVDGDGMRIDGEEQWSDLAVSLLCRRGRNRRRRWLRQGDRRPRARLVNGGSGAVWRRRGGREAKRRGEAVAACARESGTLLL